MKAFGWVFAYFCSLTGFYYGIYTSVFNNLFKIVLGKDLGVQESQIKQYEGDINGMFAFGLTISCLISGKIVFSHGRLLVLKSSDLIAFFLYFGFYYNRNIYIMILLRFIQGFTIGLGKIASYTLLTEMIPKESRGRATAFFMLNYSFGVMIVLQTGRLSQETLAQYSYIILIGFLPLTVIRLSLFHTIFNFESPTYVFQNLTNEEKKQDYQKYLEEVQIVKFIELETPEQQNELKNWIKDIRKVSEIQPSSHGFINLFKEHFYSKKPEIKFGFIFGVVLCMSIELKGTGFLAMYSNQLMKCLGSSHESEWTANLGVMIFLSSLTGLLTIDYFGRRALLLIGTGGMFTCHLINTLLIVAQRVEYMPIFFLAFDFFAYAGLVVVYSTYVSESSTAFTLGLGLTLKYFIKTLISKFLPLLLTESNVWIIVLFFLVSCGLMLPMIYYFTIETKLLEKGEILQRLRILYLGLFKGQGSYQDVDGFNNDYSGLDQGQSSREAHIEVQQEYNERELSEIINEEKRGLADLDKDGHQK